MNLLLDTHALLWWLNDDSQLSVEARKAIGDIENTVFLSSVVVWEIRIKEALGKIQLPPDFRTVLKGQEFVELPVTIEHADAVGDLPPIHRDPFDRLLVSQAICEKLTIVTRDTAIPTYGVTALEA